MIRWCIAEFLEERGWTAYGHAREARITIAAAYRLARPGPVQRIDAGTLETLCVLFGVQPGDLLEYVPDRWRGRG